MPCMGPSQEYAHKIADDITDELIARLEQKGVSTKSNKPLVAVEMQNLLDEIREIVRDLVWLDHSEGF